MNVQPLDIPQATRASVALQHLLETPARTAKQRPSASRALARHFSAAVQQIRELVTRPDVRGRAIALDLVLLALDLEERVRKDPEVRDPNWEFHEIVTRILAAIGALRQDLLTDELDEPSRAIRFSLTRLAGLPQQEIAAILGVNARTVREWKKGVPGQVRTDAERIVTVAHLIRMLDGLSPRGLLRWFNLKRRQLGNRTPLEVLEREPGSPRLRELAEQIAA